MAPTFFFCATALQQDVGYFELMSRLLKGRPLDLLFPVFNWTVMFNGLGHEDFFQQTGRLCNNRNCFGPPSELINVGYICWRVKKKFNIIYIASIIVRKKTASIYQVDT